MHWTAEHALTLTRPPSPRSPESMDWHVYYPAFVVQQAQTTEESALTDVAPHRIISLSKEVTVADIGCGFGGLLVALAPKLPDELLLGAHLYPTFKNSRLQKHRYGNPN